MAMMKARRSVVVSSWLRFDPVTIRVQRARRASRKHIYRRIRARHHRGGGKYDSDLEKVDRFTDGGPNTDSSTDIEIADLEREIRSGVNSRSMYSQASDTRGVEEFIID